jgi:hypothetical protein
MSDFDQRNCDFSKGMTDAQYAYIEAERRVKYLEVENAKLREQLDWERSENGWMREFNDRMAEHCGTKDCPSLVAYVNKIETENAKLRELAADMLRAMRRMEASAGMDALVGHSAWFAPKLHELGIEVDA